MPLHLQWCNKRKIGRFLYTVKAHKSRQDTVELSLPPIEILIFRLLRPGERREEKFLALYYIQYIDFHTKIFHKIPQKLFSER